MLELYFSNPTSLRHLRRGPLNAILDEWAAVLRQVGYKRSAASQMLSLAAKFSQYLQRLGVDDVSGINEEVAKQFLDIEYFPYGKYDSYEYYLHSLIAYLREAATYSPITDYSHYGSGTTTACPLLDILTDSSRSGKFHTS